MLSQDTVITDGKGKDMGDEFLAGIGYNKELVNQKTDRPGLCMQWVVGTCVGSKDIILIVQVKLITV